MAWLKSTGLDRRRSWCKSTNLKVICSFLWLLVHLVALNSLLCVSSQRHVTMRLFSSKSWLYFYLLISLKRENPSPRGKTPFFIWFIKYFQKWNETEQSICLFFLSVHKCFVSVYSTFELFTSNRQVRVSSPAPRDWTVFIIYRMGFDGGPPAHEKFCQGLRCMWVVRVSGCAWGLRGLVCVWVGGVGILGLN